MSEFFDELMESVMQMDEFLRGAREPAEQPSSAADVECEQFQADLLQSVRQMKAGEVASAQPPEDSAKQ